MAKAEDTIDQIIRKLEGKESLNGVDTRSLLEECFQRVPREKKQADAQGWLSWASGHKDLKTVTAAIPTQILPKGISGSLIDVKVQCRGPDDALYDKYKEIRDKVARGNCFIKVEKQDEATVESAASCIVYGLKKFTGGLGDDDDREEGDNHTWKRYFTKPLEKTSRIVCTRKANGEAGHLAAKRIAGAIYLCAGSKNVHMLFRNKDDLQYYTEPRYNIAREVSTAILTLLGNMDEAQKHLLLSFLCATELTGIFEVLQPTYQHVEDLSHLAGPEVRFITWTTSDLDPSMSSSLCSLPPHVAIEVAAILGLPTVSYDIIPFANVDARMASVREGYLYEGEVLYFMDDNNDVIGLLKKKTIWYIVCRAIREKVRVACGQQVKNPSTFRVSSSVQKIEKRMKEIQSWLGMDEESTNTWKELGVGYLKWTLHKLNAGEVEHKQIAEMFPVQWKKYLDETGQTDKILAKWKEPQGSDD